MSTACGPDELEAFECTEIEDDVDAGAVEGASTDDGFPVDSWVVLARACIRFPKVLTIDLLSIQ
jgi:hypothetical protein